MPPEEERLSQDLVFDVLSSPRRRYVLYYLREHDGSVELSELSSQVAAWENETPVEELTDQERKRVYVSLYQTHIPKLNDVGLVEYDQQSGVVTLTERVDQIDDYLSGGNGDEFPWSLYYLGLAIGAGLLVLAVGLNLWVFAGIPEVAVGVLVILAFGVSALTHFLYEQRAGDGEIPPELQTRGE